MTRDWRSDLLNLATLGLAGPRSPHEIWSRCQVQHEIPSRQLGGIRPGARAARRHHPVDLRGRDGWLEASTVRRPWRTEKILRSFDHDRLGASARLQAAASPDGRLASVTPVTDGRRPWKKESGYHPQARVETIFFRYKSVIGGRLRARPPESQEAEALIACTLLNRMFELGRPKSFAMK
jgi:hypothetical protein